MIKMSKAFGPMFIVSADVDSCFDSILPGKLVEIVDENVLSSVCCVFFNLLSFFIG